MELYCIHLRQQPERLERLKTHLSELGEDVCLNVVDGIYNSRGNIGCANSHKKIIQYAINKNMDKVVVIEDDVKMKDGYLSKLNRSYDELPEDWDILLGGVSWAKNIKERVGLNLVKIGDFSATHFIVYRKKCYGHVLKWNETIKPDNIDRYIGSLSERGILNVYCFVPFLATQFNGYSTIRNKDTDDSETFMRAERKMM